MLVLSYLILSYLMHLAGWKQSGCWHAMIMLWLFHAVLAWVLTGVCVYTDDWELSCLVKNSYTKA